MIDRASRRAGAADVSVESHTEVAGDVPERQVSTSLVPVAEPDVQRPTRRSRRQWWWLLLVMVLMGVAAGGWFAGQRVRSSDQAAAEAAPPVPSWITAPVEQRVLSQTVIGRGDVRPQVSIGVGVPSSVEGTPVVTALGVSVGDEVTEGTRVVEVSGRPVFVLAGEVPVYRTLRPEMSGADVVQLQAALARLGCDATADAGVYGPVTKSCVASLYTDVGYEPVPSSETEVADLAAAEQAVTDAQAGLDAALLALEKAHGGPGESELLTAQIGLEAAQRGYTDAVASADAAVGLADGELARAQSELDRVQADPVATPTDVAAAEGAVDAAWAAANQARRDRESSIATAGDAVTLAEAALDELRQAPDLALEQAAVNQATARRDRAQAALDALRASTGPMVPQGEVVFAPNLPARVQSAAVSLGPVDGSQPASGEEAGSGVGSSAGLVTLAAGDLIVHSTARSREEGLLRVGMPVELLDEQTNVTYPATIASLADAPATGEDGQTGFPMTITVDDGLPDKLSGSNLRVTITAASTETEALVVPVAAVSSAANGATNVSVVPDDADPDTDPMVVPVVAGISADGFVAVEPVAPNALAAGDRVVVGR